MPVTELETEIWCPRCREVMGRVLRHKIVDDAWKHERMPVGLKPYCTRCETVLVRK